MHHTEINHDEKLGDANFDLEDDHLYGYRPILLEGFAMVDGTDVLVPCSAENTESMIVALTEEQAMQALLLLAQQIGKSASIYALESNRWGK